MSRARRGFGRIRKLPSGRFQTGYVGPDTEEHYAPDTFTARMDAEAWLAQERRLIEREEWTPPAKRKTARTLRSKTFGEYALPWLERRPLKPRTHAHYSKLLEQRLLPDLADVELKKMTKHHVSEWYDAQDRKTPTYTAHAYALLRTILNSAVEDELIPVNPCQVKGAGVTRRARRIEPATLDELVTLTNAMPERQQLAVLLAAWCALRFGEVTELRRHDIDLKNRQIKVRRGVVRVDGKMIVDSPKSAAGVRTVAIPPHLMPTIVKHLDEHAQPGRTGLLFYGRDGGHLTQSSFTGHPARRRKVKGRWVDESASGFYKAREAAGRPDLRFHDLRHTGAVLAAQAGATLAELMARLGHSTPAAAMIYQHAARDRDAEIAAKLSEMASES